MEKSLFIEAYELRDKITNDGKVLVEIQKGMYGLPQAGRLAYDKLVKHLAIYGYVPCKRTPGLWQHITKDTKFTLVVDDFGIKYHSHANAEHLIAAIKDGYECTVDWDGALYCGISLEWDYTKRKVRLSMPDYVKNALITLQHILPYRPQHAPSHWQAPVYGSKEPQLAKAADDSERLDAEGEQWIRRLVGIFLFYSRAVDPTMRLTLSSIATNQAEPTKETLKESYQFLDYAATHPNAVLEYRASDMVLRIHSDASYLTERGARSRAGGHHYLSDIPINPLGQPKSTDPVPPNNGPIHTVCTIIKHVMSSAAEAEMGALHHNAVEACGFRTALEEMGHPQPPTHIQVDNSTASGISNKSIKQRRTKAMDMRFYWIQDRIQQNQFRVFWQRGADNLADYFTKHHPIHVHIERRKLYLAHLARDIREHLRNNVQQHGSR